MKYKIFFVKKIDGNVVCFSKTAHMVSLALFLECIKFEDSNKILSIIFNLYYEEKGKKNHTLNTNNEKLSNTLWNL